MDLTVKTETWTGDDQSWLAANHGTDFARSITLDSSAFTPNTHAPNGFYPSGLALGKITATGLYGPYTPAASDGTDVLAGFLLTPTKAAAVNTTDVGAALFEHGRVVEANLPIAIDANGKADVAKTISFE
jgi:hypothetical protein